MTLTLLEGAVDAISDYIQANMSTKVAALNTRYGDSLLDDIVTYYVGSLPLSTPEVPSVAFHAMNWMPGEQRLANLEVTNSIDVITFVGDDNITNRFRKLARYGMAIVELARTAKGNIAYTVKIGGQVELTDYMSTTPYLQGIIVPLTFTKYEDY